MWHALSQHYDERTVELHGLKTYWVLLMSSTIVSAAFFVLDRSYVGDILRSMVGDQSDTKKNQPTPVTDLWPPARMVAVNWVFLFPCVIAASPFFAHMFPIDAPSPPLWQSPFIAAMWLLMHDMVVWLYNAALKRLPSLYVKLNRPCHVLTERYPTWVSHALRPGEFLLQILDALLAPGIWSALFGLHLRAWWMWLAVLQLQTVTMYSGYSAPSLQNAMAMIGQVKAKQPRKEKGEKASKKKGKAATHAG